MTDQTESTPAQTTCDLCGMGLSDGRRAEGCERGDCPIERKPAPSIYAYPRTFDEDVRESVSTTEKSESAPRGD